jgi:predicted transcriptional regulator
MLDEIQKLSIKVDADKIDNCYSIVKCFYNLSNTDLEILQSFQDDKGLTIKELTENIGKDRSTIQRSLEKLISCHLCFKERKSGIPRGFIYYYYRISIKEILKQIDKNLDECYKKIKNIITHYEKSI